MTKPTMLYRRRVLLALLEAFGGYLERTDCQKLLFLFSKSITRPSYDFFPYRYGCFSIVSYRDKAWLTERGMLTEGEAFELTSPHGHIQSLDAMDRLRLRELAARIGAMRGPALIRAIYLAYPSYTIQSTIIADVLTGAEQYAVRQSWNRDEAQCLATFGYEGLSIDAYLNTLVQANIDTLIDVRCNPVSMKYGFTKSTLARWLDRIGIAYVHIPALGVPSSLRQNLTDRMAYERLFQRYQSEILPRENEGIEELRRVLEGSTRSALMCFEADPTMCHRHKITEYLMGAGWLSRPVMHLTGPRHDELALTETPWPDTQLPLFA